jgi:hypothetical protein
MNSFSFSDNSRTTSISRKLFILQYNVHKFKNIVMTTFLRDSAVKKFDIIAIQESWINAYANITHHSLKDNHFLFYSDQVEMKKYLVRVCIFVIKRIFIDDLKYLFRSKDVMIVQIRMHKSHYLHLHNVYNESNILSFLAPQDLRFALKSSSNEQFRNHIIVKDLNIHHSSWDDVSIRSNSKSLKMLLLMNEFRLQSNLSRETSTYFHFQKSESIIDMCLTTESLNNRILICKTRSDLNHDSNHFLIETILNISISETAFFERFNWNRLNMKKFKNSLNYLIFEQSTSQSFFNKTQIDVYIKSVCSAIAEVIDTFISKFKTSTRVIFEFDETCNLTRIRANQVRRTFQDELVAQENTKQTFLIWKKAKAIKKRIIRKILRIIHRNVVFSVIENAQKTWKLAKWAKNRSTSFKLIISFLRRSNDIMTLTKKAKARCLINSFFLSFAAINLDEIDSERTTYSKSIDFFKISENEISQTIVKIVSNIVSKENDIFNRVIKLVLSHIVSVVKWIFNQSLRLEYCLKHFREFITMFLRKINKSDYFVFKTYRFIALLNILNKIMKSIMTTRLSYAAKKHNLLFKKHFEDRKNIVSKHALHYIIETINSIWVNKKITIMLLLNVIEVFDNVSHLRLLHNLRKRRIENIYLIWMKSFFSKRHIILKLIDHIIDRIRTVIDVF